MNLIAAVKSCFINYFNFKGRATRSEFWWFVFFCVIVDIALAFMGGFDDNPNLISHKLEVFFNILTFIPAFSVGARRLHDINRTGWLQLFYFVPVVGWIYLLYLFVQASENEIIRFGD